MKFSQVVEEVKVGVLLDDFPEKLLTMEQMDKIQGKILQLILTAKGSDHHSRFLGMRRKPGFLVLDCKDESTTRWLLSVENVLLDLGRC